MSQTFVETGESEFYGALNRQPKNINPLYQNKFQFFLIKLPECSLTCQTANIPAITGESWQQVTSVNPIPRSGLNMTFDELEINFIVDADLNNYFELAQWMRMLYMVKNSKSYEKVQLEQLQPQKEGGLTSDAQLILLTNQSVPNVIFYFRNAFPTYLSQIQLSNEVDDLTPITATAKFTYTYYDFENIIPKDTTETSI